MELIIRASADCPIYEQIVSQIKAQIIAGTLEPGQALPSIRGLAKDLKVSVITTKRAYEELEGEGFIYTVGGKGCFVAETDLEWIRARQRLEAEKHIQAAIMAGKTCGETLESMTEILKKQWKEME